MLSSIISIIVADNIKQLAALKIISLMKNAKRREIIKFDGYSYKIFKNTINKIVKKKSRFMTGK